MTRRPHTAEWQKKGVDMHVHDASVAVRQPEFELEADCRHGSHFRSVPFPYFLPMIT